MTAKTAEVTEILGARIEKLTQALMHVAGEMWVMRDRQAVLERLLIESGTDAPTLIDSYHPDAELASALEAEREAYILRILSYLAPDD